MKKQKYTPFQLLDFGGPVFQITCSECKRQHIEYILDEEAVIVQRLFDEGWRAARKKCYCPECAKKKLRQS